MQIRLTGLKTKREEVEIELDESSFKEEILKYFSEKLKINDSIIIRNGIKYEIVEVYGHNGYEDFEKKIGLATKHEINNYIEYEKIKKILV